MCEPVDDPNGNDEEKIPRVILYTERGQKQDLARSANTPESEKGQLQDPLFRSSDTSLELSTSKQDARYCIECGSRLRSDSKFCTRCGTKQENV